MNYGQFFAKRPKLQIFYLSIGLLYFRLEQDGAESTWGWLLTYGIPRVTDFTSPHPAGQSGHRRTTIATSPHYLTQSYANATIEGLPYSFINYCWMVGFDYVNRQTISRMTYDVTELTEDQY
jgi:hypothetical protein